MKNAICIFGFIWFLGSILGCVLWVITIFQTISYNNGCGTSLGFMHGAIRVEVIQGVHGDYCGFDSGAYFGIKLFPEIVTTSTRKYISIPLWPLFFGLIGFVIFMNRLTRTINKTQCLCGYSLIGISSVRCPECGQVISRESETQSKSG